MEILSTLTGKIVELTVEPIRRQVQYLLCYKNNLKELGEKVKELGTQKERVDQDVQAERRNGRDIHTDVLRWQEGVIETIGEAEKLCKDGPHASLQCWKWSFPNFKSRHQLGRKAKKMGNAIVEMRGKGNFDKGVGYAQPLDITNNFCAPRGSDDKLASRNSVEENVILSLKDPKVTKVGVYGISGVGKTTLIKQVAKHVKEDNLFDTVVMVTISQADLERMQDEIAEQLGLDTLKGITSSIGRASCLCERIKREKSILIILDDLREIIDLEKVGIPCFDTRGNIKSEKIGVPLKNDYKGCKLLSTSRTRDTLQNNDIENNFSLQVLNDSESWSLFEDMVGDVVKDPEFQTIATQVAKRCAGLPVLIVTIAKSLKGKEIYHWNNTLSNLKSVEDKNMQETLYSALKFNFDGLEVEVQEVFLLCGVLGTSIVARDLLKYVIGLGIFKRSTVEDARNRLYTIIDGLKASCLLVDDDERAEMIQMHDRVREVAILIASNVFTRSKVTLQDWPSKDILERCTHIILVRCYIQNLPEMLDCPCLKFLHINSFNNRTLEIPDSFFTGMGNLEALDFTGFIISSLPSSLRSLTKLKALCLDICSLKDMTGIGDLINVEILSLHKSSIEEFPREIGKLTKLRILDLSKSRIGTAHANILSKLAKIEELYMGGATINWELESSTKQKRNASGVVNLGHLKDLTALEIQVREASLLPKDVPFEKLERYKVVIGDKWEWSANKETSRLLRVKLLDTNIRSERGIQTLIKRVEDLYLDEIGGISNVLFDLNGEGFSLLKHLHIQNNSEIQQIINSRERNQTPFLFPKVEAIILYNLKNLVEICHGPVRYGSFGKLKVVKVKNCDKLEYLFSISMVKAFSQLVEIEVSKCNSMKNIVSTKSVNSNNAIVDEKIEFLSLRSLTLQHLPIIDDFCSQELTSSQRIGQNSLMAYVPTPFFSGKVKFFHLETLKLSSVNLEKIWDDNQATTLDYLLVRNLVNLTVESCNGLKYLFSSSVVGRILNLKEVEISKCDMMEEIIATEETNDATILGEVLFPNLESIIVKDMKNLKMLWNVILASTSSLPCLKTLKVNNCEKIENIVPEYMEGVFATLETLEIEDCKSVQKIFQLGVSNKEDDTVAQLKCIKLLRLPQLKQIWSTGSQSSIQFKNLQAVHVEECEVLEYLFPYSIAMNLPLLEKIEIHDTGKMKEIVSKREEPLDNHVEFRFNQLTTLVLADSQNLLRFCSGNHSLYCSSLKYLMVIRCGKLKLFKTRDTSSQERLYDGNFQVSLQQPFFTIEEVIGNLELLCLPSDDMMRMLLQEQCIGRLKHLMLSYIIDYQTTFLYRFLQNITSLEDLSVCGCSCKEIFLEEKEVPVDAEGKIVNRARIKYLRLYQLHELQHICKERCQIDQVLEVLECLEVHECPKLKNLVPSSVTLGHVTYLEVQGCKGMIHLISSSTATSLVKLETLKIRECNSMEKIVAEEGEEIENEEIAFNSLEVLELDSLPKLQMFCSSTNCILKLPLLEKLVLRQCPRMSCFSLRETFAPMLQKIITDEQDGIHYWEVDLTGTVNKLFHDKVALSSVNLLELSEYPELEELWYSQVSPKIFCNLKHLVVRKCTFLSNMLFSSNLLQLLYTLEELEVAECDSLEAIFDVKALDDKAVVGSKKVSRLKKLTLSELQNLKLIWNRELEEIISFGNLESVRVDKCQHLKYLFSVSLCQDLSQLEELLVESCDGVEQIVSIEEGRAVDELKFDFPRLATLKLYDLMQLTNFYPGRYTLECPLKSLNVGGCEKLQIFAFDHLNPQLFREGEIELQTKQALFDIEKVSQNLEDLTLNEKDAMRILKSTYGKNLFPCVNMLVLEYFCETPMKFLNDLIQKFPATTTFGVRCSNSLEILFPSEKIGNCSIESATQIKELWLYKLEQLEHIWNDISAADALVPNLQQFYIVACHRLRRLAPPLTCFTNLTALIVKDCNGLMYLISPCTAKSLVHLTILRVENCDMLEEIVMTDESESKEEITFESLVYLELKCLSGFKSFCSGKHTFIFPSLMEFIVTGCHKMQNFTSGDIVAPFLKSVVVENEKERWKEDLNTTIKQLFIDNKEIGGAEGDNNIESSSIIQSSSQNNVGTSRGLSFQKQEIQKNVLINIPHTGSNTPKSCEIVELPLDQVDDAAVGSQDITTHQGTLSPTIVQDTDTGTKEMLAETIQNGEDMSIHVSSQDRADMDKEMSETIQNDEDMSAIIIPVSTQDIAAVKIKSNQIAEAHDGSDFHLSKNLFDQITTSSMVADYKELTVGSQEEYESKRSFSVVPDAQNILGKPDETQITLGNTVMEENIAAIDPSLSHHQDLETVISSVQDQGKSDEPGITPAGNNLSFQTTSSIMAENIAAAPSQASNKAASLSSSSATPAVADTCSSFKELDISVQLLPYLKAGVKRHPQVLNWLNTKRRRVFASSSLSLFAEVTRILRTTRRVDLTEDDRNHIRECCAVLQGVGFDDGWISYVHGRIEKCGNDEEDLEWKIDEAEAQIESMKEELASVLAKANRLHGYIYLSTLLNALLVTILFFFLIVYFHQKTN